MRTFERVKIEPGTPLQMGIQYGRQAAEKIRAGVADYKKLFLENYDMSWEAICGYAATFVPIVEAAMPEIMEEARGIAKGAEISVDDVMVLNCRYEITKFPRPNECTSFSLQPETTKDGKTVVGQDWDYRAGILDNIVVVHAEQPDGTRLLGLAEAGQVIRNGFNSRGIGLCANNLQSVHDTRGTGIPVTFLRRRVLASRTFEEASEVIRNVPRDVSCNFMLASATGQTADFETYPGGADRIDATDGILTHANHFVVNPANEALETSPRGQRLYDLLAAHRGEIDVPYIAKCLSDHENYPKAICRHPSDVSIPLAQRGITVASVIYDLDERTGYICAGPPCEGAYVEYHL